MKITDKTLDDLITKILYLQHGNRCQTCGQIRTDCQKMHILSKGSHPELRFELYNIVWSCWGECHGPSHNGKSLDEALKKIKGDKYKENLWELARINRVGKLDREYIKKHLEGVLHALQK